MVVWKGPVEFDSFNMGEIVRIREGFTLNRFEDGHYVHVAMGTYMTFVGEFAHDAFPVLERLIISAEHKCLLFIVGGQLMILVVGIPYGYAWARNQMDIIA